MKQKKIAIIGHFGGKENFTDGQTVKTKILHSELCAATDWKIQIVDTYFRKKNPIKLLWDLFCSLLTTKDFIILLSGNGMRFFFPLFAFSSKFFKKRIYHDVIGGNLDCFVVKYPKFKEYLNSFRVNWVETEGLKKKMEEQGVTTCIALPNFKRLQILSPEKMEKEYSKPYRFCTFSRVMREKGIGTAMDTVAKINREAGEIVCTLDIFGNVDASYKEEFEKEIVAAPEGIRYGGLVPYDKSVETIGAYHALLFPTFWKGEGFPGTIVDAYSAGLPVIASNWNCNGELIEHEKTGFLYDLAEKDGLECGIRWLMENIEKLHTLRCNCLETAKKYQPEIHIQTIINTICEEK